MNVHQNARTTLWSRREIVRRVLTLGQPIAPSRRCVTVTKSPGRSAKTVSGVASKTIGQAAFSTSRTRFSLTRCPGRETHRLRR
jgi:hypothetical protein